MLSLGREAAEAARFIWRSSVLRANTALSLVGQLSTPVVTSLTPALIFQRFAVGNTELGAAQFGAAEAAIALGAVMGALCLPRFIPRWKKGQVILAGFGLYGVVLIALAYAQTFEVALVVFGFAGVVNVVFYVSNITLAQEVTPPELRARVFGTRIALLNLSWLPVILVSGALADVLGVALLVALAGLLTFATAIVGAFIPVVRDVP